MCISDEIASYLKMTRKAGKVKQKNCNTNLCSSLKIKKSLKELMFLAVENAELGESLPRKIFFHGY